MLVGSCQKKAFKRVTVRGVILNSISHQPVQTKVYLVADDATSSKNSQQQSMTLSSTQSNVDGSFVLESKASKRNTYYIHANDSTGKRINVKVQYSYSFSAVENGTKELGNIYIKW